MQCDIVSPSKTLHVPQQRALYCVTHYSYHSSRVDELCLYALVKIAFTMDYPIHQCIKAFQYLLVKPKIKAS